MPRKKEELDFEESLKALETLVQKMEQGELSLQQSLEAFEEGVKLTRACQQQLESAEQRVQVLVEKNGEVTATPLDPEKDV